ncbi:MbnP family protein [Crocinitomix algicola]|uniref:MbnP family protein n=1 Tax=Crocinitomix algicola TaxID=1740263 RepID=UPI00082CACB5|nr:MbnP family protein [Crocinitomix algicola]
MRDKSLILVFAIIGFTFITGCKKSGTKLNSDLKISFQTTVNGTDYGIGDSYKNDLGVEITYELFQFYLSDIEIHNSDGEKRLISEIELFKFNSNGIANLDFKVPHGNYEKISFGIGVKATLNDADPSNYAEDGHPLSTTQNTYWGWVGKYRFVMAEGRYDSDGDGTIDGTFAYHTGYNVSYRTLNLNHNFEIDKKSANTLNFNIDLKKLLDNPGNEIIISETPFYHGAAEDEHLTIKLSDNFQSSISITE